MIKTDKGGVEFFRSNFSEKHTFSLDSNFDNLTVKVYATLIEGNQEEVKGSTERLIASFEYVVKDSLIQWFDQKEHTV